jgi:hypothetical protein
MLSLLSGNAVVPLLFEGWQCCHHNIFSVRWQCCRPKNCPKGVNFIVTTFFRMVAMLSSRVNFFKSNGVNTIIDTWIRIGVDIYLNQKIAVVTNVCPHGHTKLFFIQ